MTEQATVAALIGLAMALVKVVEKLVEWGVKKVSPTRADGKDRSTVVHLDPETTRLIHEIHAHTSSTDETVSLRDQDGMPMVYTPRSLGDGMKQVAQLLRDSTLAQQRMLDRLESLDERVEEVRASQRKGPRAR